MERYSCAYRDPNSPLTPLTPLTDNIAFKFDFGGDKSLDDVIKYTINNSSKSNINSEQDKENISPNNIIITKKPERFSDSFNKLRSVFEKPLKSSPRCNIKINRVVSPFSETPKYRVARTLNKSKNTHLMVPSHYQFNHRKQLNKLKTNQFRRQKQVFRQASPIAARPLSPRFEFVLRKFMLIQFKEIFQKEEIDMEVFSALTRNELIVLGITNADDQEKILNVVRLADKIENVYL